MPQLALVITTRLDSDITPLFWSIFHWEQRTDITKTCLPTAIGKALLNL